MSIIAFVTDPVPLHALLSYLDLPTRPPPLSPARAPPQGIFGFDQTDGFDPADFSLAEAVSFEVMTGRGIREVLTLDHHFSAVGFVMVPAP